MQKKYIKKRTLCIDKCTVFATVANGVPPLATKKNKKPDIYGGVRSIKKKFSKKFFLKFLKIYLFISFVGKIVLSLLDMFFAVKKI